MFPISWDKMFRKKDGGLVTMDEAMSGGGGGGSLPPHSAADAGKVLGVTNDDLLAWISAPSLHMYKVTTNQYIVREMLVLTTVNEENLNTYDKLKNALTTGIGFVISGQNSGTTDVPTFAKYNTSDSYISVYCSMSSTVSNDIWRKSTLLGTAEISGTKIF